MDTGVLGLVTHPSRKPEPRRCKEWFKNRLEDGFTFYVPEIADYELRRKLLHLRSGAALDRLDDLQTTVSYLPITTAAMRRAAEFWADARRKGFPTAAEPALDGDVILAAQAVTLPADEDGASVVVATSNVGHLNRFVPARRWQEIT